MKLALRFHCNRGQKLSVSEQRCRGHPDWESGTEVYCRFLRPTPAAMKGGGGIHLLTETQTPAVLYWLITSFSNSETAGRPCAPSPWQPGKCFCSQGWKWRVLGSAGKQEEERKHDHHLSLSCSPTAAALTGNRSDPVRTGWSHVLVPGCRLGHHRCWELTGTSYILMLCGVSAAGPSEQTRPPGAHRVLVGDSPTHWSLLASWSNHLGSHHNKEKTAEPVRKLVFRLNPSWVL